MKKALCDLKNQIGCLQPPKIQNTSVLKKVKDNVVVGLMAGGEGSRFKAVTKGKQVQKNAFELPNGETMIERTIKLYKNAGVTNFVALVYTHADTIIDILGDGSKYGVNIKYSFDPEKPAGKGGAVKNAFLNNSFDNSQYLIIHNPDDQILDFEDHFVDHIISGHLEGEAAGKQATIVVVEEMPYAFTGMKIIDNTVREIEMYPMIPIPTHIGVTIFSPGMFDFFDELFDLSKKSDFEKVLFPILTEKRLLNATSIPNDAWLAVNDIKAYKKFVTYLNHVTTSGLSRMPNNEVSPLFILYGGPSSEREVSFGTKDFFLNMYEECTPTPIEWLENFSFEINGQKYDETRLLMHLLETEGQVLIASHGEYVEDGYIQNVFEQVGIPFTGSDATSCKLAMDKLKTQEAVEDIVDTIPTYMCKPAKFSTQELEKHFELQFPIFAKPNNLGSSIGVYKIENQTGLERILGGLPDIPYLFQPAIVGKELSLGSVRTNAGFMTLWPTEIIPKSQFFDYEAKYEIGGSEEITPANITEEQLQEIRQKTNAVHHRLGLGYYSRSDFILSTEGILYYLETNPLPGMTKTSLVPQQLRHANRIEEFKEGLLLNLIPYK